MAEELTPTPEALRRWGVTLLKGHKVPSLSGPLTVQHFEQLCTVPFFRDSLAPFTRLINTPAYCRQVRLNLQLAKLRKRWSSNDSPSNDRESVVQGQAGLLQAQAALGNTAQQLSADNHKCNTVQRQLRCAQQRAVLLEAVGTQMVRDRRLCENHLSNIEADIKSWNDQLQLTDAGQTVSLQECMDDILRRIVELRLKVINSDGSDRELSHLRELKAELWRDVGSHCKKYSSAALLGALSSVARQATSDIHRTTAQLDLTADAAALKLELRKTGPALPDAGVKELLALMAAAHIEAHLNATQVKTAVEAKTKAKDAINAMLLVAIKHKHPDPDSASSVSKLVQQCIAGAGARAAQAALAVAAQELHTTAAAAMQRHRELLQLQQQIQSKEEVVRKSMHQLQCLSSAVDVGRELLQEHRSATLSTSTLPDVSVPAPMLPPQLMKDEVTALSTLPLTSLTSTKLHNACKILQKDLTILTSTSTDLDDADLLGELSKLVGACSSSMSMEHFNAALNCGLSELVSLRAGGEQATHTNKTLRSATAPLLATLAIKDVCASVDASDEALESGTIEALQTCERQLKEANKALVRTREAYHNWWHQPAKDISISSASHIQ